MSRVDLSPEQLDAMAAGPVKCPRCRMLQLPEFPHNHDTPPRPDYDPMPSKPATLEARIATIAREYAAELPSRLHTHTVPSQVEPIELDGWEDGPVIEVTDSGPLGAPSFSPQFHRYIGAARFWEGEMVMADADLRPFPWTRNLEGVRRWCAGKHRTWYEHRGLPLCWTLVRLVVLGGYSISRAGQLEGIPPERAESLVTTAIDKWWAWTSNDLNRIEMRPRRPAA